MKWLCLPLLCALALQADDPDDRADVNVNARYTVDRVHVAYVRNQKKVPELSANLRTDIDQVVGQKLDNTRLAGLATLIKRELHVPDVSFKVAKGATPDHVTVNFEVNERQESFDVDVPKFAYHSRQGWSGEGKFTLNIHGNAFNFGLLSDNDSLAERFAGIRAGYERKSMGTDRLQLRFQFASYHSQWNGATWNNEMLGQGLPSEVYHNRTSFTPEATVVLAAPLQLSFGVDFTRIEPSGNWLMPGDGTRSSNAAVSALRYQRRWGTSKDVLEQSLQASYAIRVATGVLESDYSFSRHQADASYRLRHGRSRIDLRFLSGHVSGYAPIYERFVLGNTRTLRGWNKYDLNPSGAANAVHGSLEYSYAGCLVFYDTGTAWDRPAAREQKQSLGVGYRTKDGFQIAVAFPVKTGSVDPIFYAGVGF